jgi:hypothetical protein
MDTIERKYSCMDCGCELIPGPGTKMRLARSRPEPEGDPPPSTALFVPFEGGENILSDIVCVDCLIKIDGKDYVEGRAK